MSLKVIGAGLGRTGTFSLKLGLETLLDAPCYHMFEVFKNPTHVQIWHDAALGKPVDWNSLLDGFDAAVDWPASAYWKPLSEAFPEAIIVLSKRDAEKWYTSASNTIFPSIHEARDSEEGRAWQEMIFAMMENTFTRDLMNKDTVIAEFEKHNAHVIASAPANRLVVWEATDGWEPLCSALNLPIPSQPFPKANTTEEFQAQVEKRKSASTQDGGPQSGE